MTCRSVQDSLSAHLDGRLPEGRQQGVLAHLSRCRQCGLVYEQLLEVRLALKELPVLCPPERLSMDLAVLASRERLRQLNRRSPAAWLAAWQGSARLWMDNLMRPLALPLAGGVVSALLLFSMLMPNIAFSRHTIVRDVPISLFTEATVKSQPPFGFSDDDIILEVAIDEQGRMTDYSVAQGHHLAADPRLRRSIENNLLFTEFHPRTSFGQPTASRLFVSFKRSHFTVKS